MKTQGAQQFCEAPPPAHLPLSLSSKSNILPKLQLKSWAWNRTLAENTSLRVKKGCGNFIQTSISAKTLSIKWISHTWRSKLKRRVSSLSIRKFTITLLQYEKKCEEEEVAIQIPLAKSDLFKMQQGYWEQFLVIQSLVHWLMIGSISCGIVGRNRKPADHISSVAGSSRFFILTTLTSGSAFIASRHLTCMSCSTYLIVSRFATRLDRSA